ncbi:hypothetical protein SprV_0902768600 [Sparganum proliferum]
MEGVASFVLPIIDVFGPPKHVEHRFFFEIFQIIQFAISIMALAYLQALIAYYTGKQIVRECGRIDEEEREEVEEETVPGRPQNTRELPRIFVCPPSNDDLSIFCEPDASARLPWGQVDHRDGQENGREVNEESRVVNPEIRPNEIRSGRHSRSEPFMNHLENGRLSPPLTEPYCTSNPSVTLLGQNDSAVHEDASCLPDNRMKSIRVNDCKTERKDSYGEFKEEEEEKEQGKKKLEFLGGNTSGRGRHIVRKPFFGISRFFRHKSRKCQGQFRAVKWEREGINLYLRLGAVVFGFGVMILDGFSVSDRFQEDNYNNSCHSVLWIPKNVIHSIYIFLQTYFLFKYHRVVFNVQKFFLRFILSHMAVVNLGQWLSTVVQEVMTTSVGSSDLSLPVIKGLRDVINYQQPGNASDIQLDVHSGNTSGIIPAESEVKCHSQASVLAHYLIPCGVEYSLIACAIFYKLFQRIGHDNGGEDHMSSHRIGDSAPDGRVYNECHRAHKGLFVGLLVFMATLVALALFYILYNEHKLQSAVTLYQVTNVILLAIGIITVFLALLRFRLLTLRKLSETNAFDDNLLLVGLLGMLFYDMFLLVPAFASRESKGMAAYLFVTKAALEIVQALMQVFLILEASRRCVKSQAHALNKPGRTLLTFLLVLNLAMWVVNTFELKHAENHHIHKKYYTGIAWKIITHLSLPLLIFFRFHSTVCLADIWSNAYKLHR